MIDGLPHEGSALVVVAHPDDETLWCGGVIFSHPELDWTVLSLCRGSDPDRRPKFEAACHELGATPIILDVNDDPDLPVLDQEEDVILPIDRAVGAQRWQVCLTHGRNGEYGHPRHVDVHQAMLEMMRRGQLECDRFWVFAYERDRNGRMRTDAGADVTIEFSTEMATIKRNIITDVYGFGQGSFESDACLGEESFFRIL